MSSGPARSQRRTRTLESRGARMSLPHDRVPRRVGGRPQGAAGQGEGVHPAARRAEHRAPPSCRWSRSTRTTSSTGPDGKVRLLDLFEGRRQLDRRPLHVRPELGRRLPELHGRRRRGLRRVCSLTCTRATRRSRTCRARRSRRSRTTRQRRGLDVPVVLVVRHPTSTTTSTSRSTSRSRRSSTTSGPRPSASSR